MTEEGKADMGNPITVVAALGNFGTQYARTRHNIAWQMIEYLSFYDELQWQEKFKGVYAPYLVPRRLEKVYFLKPMTYMNLSGRSLVELMNFFQVEPERVLVIHDELELDFGVIGFKRGGGLGGHNGLRSVTENLGTRDFNRLRLGISRPPHRDITSYVLGPFSEDERIELPTFLEASARLLEECLVNGFGAMERSHRKVRLLQEFQE
jgi:PTH1 family peptidyl-tRNA hydrolase